MPEAEKEFCTTCIAYHKIGYHIEKYLKAYFDLTLTLYTGGHLRKELFDILNSYTYMNKENEG